MGVDQDVEAAHGAHGQPIPRVSAPRSARQSTSRQPVCSAMRLLCARVLVSSLRCGPSDGGGGTGSAAGIRQARLVDLPRPSMRPRRALLPAAPASPVARQETRCSRLI